MMTTSGGVTFFDGATSARHAVTVDLAPDVLRIRATDGTLLGEWPYDKLEAVPAPEGVLRLGQAGSPVLARLEVRDRGLAEAEDALGRGHGLEFVVAPLGENGPVGGPSSQHVRGELDRHGVFGAGRAVEEGAWAGNRHEALRFRPHSARRQDLRRPARPAVRRRSPVRARRDWRCRGIPRHTARAPA